MLLRPPSSALHGWIAVYLLLFGGVDLHAHDPRLDSTVFASGLYRPVDLEFSADGRLFVTEQPGKIKVFPSLDAAEPILVADLSKQIFPFLDTGMLGLAVHPSFPSEPYIYVTHVLAEGTNPAGRLVRITVDPATNQEVAGTRLVLLEGWCRKSRASGSHGIDDVVFGPDGALYVSAGDWSNAGDLTDTPACPDPPGYGGIFRSQDRQTPDDPQYHNGTVIRVDPLTGAAMAGNPFESAADPNLRYVIADGLRNPYRITFQPGTDTMWIGDVGEARYEEINRIDDVNDAVVENFGWPCVEGPIPFNRGAWAQPELCAGITITPPVFTYPHRESAFAGDDCTPGSNGSSVSGLAFYEGGDYPSEYVGALFVAEYARNCVWAMLPDATGNPDPSNMVTVLDSAAGPVDLAVGPNGDLFFSDIAGGKIHRIVVNSTPPPDDLTNFALSKPVAQSSTSNSLGPERAVDGLLGGDAQEISQTQSDFQAWWQIDLLESAMIEEVVLWNRTDCCQERLTDFHVLVSETPFGSFDLQATIAQPGVSDYHHPGTAGRETRIPIQTAGRYVRIQLTGTDLLQLAEVEVFARPNGAGDPPVVTIDSPSASFTWMTGSPIDFSGSAVASGGEVLPASALQWTVLLNHCIDSVTNCHQHQMQQVNGASGSVSGPDHGYPSSVELRLTATDPATGAYASASLTLLPQTVQLTFDTAPAGLDLIAGESTDAAPTPFVREFVIGSTVSMIAPISQTYDGAELTFQSWSNGGGRLHSMPAPSSPTTYVASYAACSYTVASATNNLDASGGSGAVLITAPAHCAWSVSGKPSWVTILSGGSGVGDGVVSYEVSPFAQAGVRQGEMTVAGKTHTVTQTGVATLPHELGAFTDGVWFVDRNGDLAFDPATEISGWGSPGDTPVRGDWNGDGFRDLGVFSNGTWYLDRNGDAVFDPATEIVGWGAAGWLPVTGDWNGDGKTDIGAVDPATSTWFLDLNGDLVFDPATEIRGWGSPGDTPVVGDWNGDGADDIGVFSSGTWFLDLNGDGVFDPATEQKGWGVAGWMPVVGDWNGDGADEIGAVAPDSTWFRDLNGDFAFDPATEVLGWGAPGDKPAVADWNGDGVDDVGVFSGGMWFIDSAGNGVFDPGTDMFGWGVAGWTPVAGAWQ